MTIFVKVSCITRNECKGVCQILLFCDTLIYNC